MDVYASTTYHLASSTSAIMANIFPFVIFLIGFFIVLFALTMIFLSFRYSIAKIFKNRY